MNRRNFLFGFLTLPFIPAIGLMAKSFKPDNQTFKRKVWTVDDIEAGRWITRATAFGETVPNIGYAATVTKQIGYMLNPKKEKYCYTYISDGWTFDNFTKGFTKEQLVDELNNDPIGYRYLSAKEMVQIQMYLTKNFKG